MSRFDKDSLGNRMKKYEDVTNLSLTPFEPVIIRVDGKAFHTFTKGLKKPFDPVLNDVMKKTMLSLCNDFGNCKFGYTQSDEITLILFIEDPVKQEGVYSDRVQKIASIAASKATKYFNKHWDKVIRELKTNPDNGKSLCNKNNSNIMDVWGIILDYEDKCFEAEFDARVFNVPAWDIMNMLIWRQQDAVRNSISSVGHAYFSNKELHKKNSSEIQDMLMEKDINWNDFPVYNKRGSCCYRVCKEITAKGGEIIQRMKWEIDDNMPILTEPESKIEFEHIILGDIKRRFL